MSWDGRIRADARALPIADETVQCVVTSPPYWGLRDYGQDGQIGLEKTPQEYVETMRGVFREVWRVLKPDGVLWLNLGDCYVAKAENQVPQTTGLRPKNLVGIPWRVAFALQADRWWLRSDIVWAKPNPMPESVRDRPTRAHEYVFMLTKSARYFYDAEAIKDPSLYPYGPNAPDKIKIKSPYGQGFSRRSAKQRGHGRRHDGFNDRWDAMTKEEQCSLGRNKRSVWTIATRPYPEAHYATFPEELPEICIRASTRTGDIVLDPFFGSGTVGRVAERLNRRWIGIDLGYQDLQAKRLRGVQREFTART